MTQNNDAALPRLDARPDDSHKGNYGHCLLVGGSPGMYGAIAMAGQAALRSGAGLVTVATPAPCLQVIAGFEPCYMTHPLPVESDGSLGDAARQAIEDQPADCIACGPGLGRARGVATLVHWMVQTRAQPMVIDADGLNALAEEQVDLRRAAGPRVLTPHPGEFRRLVGDARASVPELRKIAPDWARDQQVILVLKSHHTLITDGQQVFENATGNPGMATGGMGDVLTGMVLAMLGQGLAALSAARLAVYLHGLAGDLAAARIGQISLIARDLIDTLPAAFQRHQAADSPETTSRS